VGEWHQRVASDDLGASIAQPFVVAAFQADVEGRVEVGRVANGDREPCRCRSLQLILSFSARVLT
jgi:hypothetical protein